jgi:glycopeptide antibiotics resistance protein
MAVIKNQSSEGQPSLRKTHIALLTGLYAVAVVYASLIIGPSGLHFVPMTLADGWAVFLKTGFVDHGSDQRADWISNMLMLIPFAYLLNSTLSFGKGWFREASAAVLALIVSIVFVLAVKYAQLFFPPRTVTLNYIVAQSIGAVLGLILYRLFHSRLYPYFAAKIGAGEGLAVLLGIYTVWLIAYFLMPFDFTLSLGDLAQRASDLTDMVAGLPDPADKPVQRVLLTLANTLTAAPVGMFLAITGRERSVVSLLLRGLGLILVATFLTLFVLSARPFAFSIVYRMVGVGLGIWLMRKLRGKDLRKRHYYFSRYIPLALPAYVILIMFTSGVLSNQWVTWEQAKNALEARQFLPFWNFYIVSKAHAAQSLVKQLMLFAPIGVMVWVRRGFWAKGAGFSAFVAFGLSLAMEVARLMKPGLRPDFSNPVIAAAAAAIAFKVMPTLWRMFEREAMLSGTLDSYIADMQKKAAQPAVAAKPSITKKAKPSAPKPFSGFAKASAAMPDRNLAYLFGFIILFIAYGSLYPFDFQSVPDGVGALPKLFGSWAKVPGRGDFISNILLYIPLGLCGAAISGNWSKRRRMAQTILIGAALSFTIECLQYYDIGRDTEATDFYANVMGAVLGAVCTRFFGHKFRIPLLREITDNPVPTFLIVAWMGYRLYPYVPTIDLHKYWNTLKPVILTPGFNAYYLFRQTTTWLVLALLIEKIAGRQSTTRLYFLFALFIVGATILILYGTLSVERIAGIGAGFCLWRILRDRRRALYVTSVTLMAVYIAGQQLEPFQFTATDGHFGWVPFLSFMGESIDLDIQSFFEKFFLYGSMIWLIGQGPVKMRTAALAVAICLFVTSWLEIFIPGRSAEITDALMALGIGTLMNVTEIERQRRTVTETVSMNVQGGLETVARRA